MTDTLEKLEMLARLLAEVKAARAACTVDAPESVWQVKDQAEVAWNNEVNYADPYAAINALPELVAICNAAKTALGHLDDPTGGDEINDMRRASDVLRAALKEKP